MRKETLQEGSSRLFSAQFESIIDVAACGEQRAREHGCRIQYCLALQSPQHHCGSPMWLAWVATARQGVSRVC